jgi:hypothetical protein
MPAFSPAPKRLIPTRRILRVPEAEKGGKYKSRQTNVNDADADQRRAFALLKQPARVGPIHW